MSGLLTSTSPGREHEEPDDVLVLRRLLHWAARGAAKGVRQYARARLSLRGLMEVLRFDAERRQPTHLLDSKHAWNVDIAASVSLRPTWLLDAILTISSPPTTFRSTRHLPSKVCCGEQCETLQVLACSRSVDYLASSRGCRKKVTGFLGASSIAQE